MKAFFKRIAEWFSNTFHANKIKAEFDKAIAELVMLRDAVVDLAAQKDEFEALVTKQKKQIKDLKAKIKELKGEE